MKQKTFAFIAIILIILLSFQFIVEASKGNNGRGNQKTTTNETVVVEDTEAQSTRGNRRGNNNSIPIEEELLIEKDVESGITIHVVQSGDTLWRLALQYNTTIDTIKTLNNLTSDTLWIGQVLIVPAPTEIEEEKPSQKKELMKLGYYTKYWATDKGSYESLTSYHSYLNTIAVTSYDVTANGTIEGFDASEAVEFAKANGIKPLVTIQNKFDPVMTNKILSSASLRTTTVLNMLELVQSNDYEGINLNFENMYASDRSNFNEFVRELVEVFHEHNYPVIISVPAKTGDFPTWAWSGTFEYRTIGELADYVQIMTYDQHGSWGAPGPVAGLNWVENVLKYATNEIPAEKILIGLPAYAYDWNLDKPSVNRALTWKNVRNLLNTTNATVQWDAVSQSPFFHYTDGNGDRHTVWFENEQSISLKAELVHKYELGGVSTWRMGQEDESFWKAVHQGLDQ